MHTNRLAREKSPYLLQHAHNPVDWFPWGEEAFEKSRSEDKPIFLSIGYSTCHWCHVMERESFESESVAEVLNRHFVPVKVDREERPDVDRIYMAFVQATTGSGGWPMSVWLAPDLKPFFGGTYFPPDSRWGRPGFVQILEQIASAWLADRARIARSSEEVIAELRRVSEVKNEGSSWIDSGALDSCFAVFRRVYDAERGGFGGPPKFPRPVAYNFLFRYYERTGNREALDMTLHTLREMARGGMYDQLGGGFHRYSVDGNWLVPHFEKMLYDQAQLAVSYLEASQITGEDSYAAVARDVFEYVMRDMTAPGGAFYSAEDADSVIHPDHPHEKGEGAFYIWSAAEIESVLGKPKASRFGYRYGVEPNGNVHEDPHGEFTGRNILFQRRDLAETAREFDADEDELRAAFAEARTKLMAARSLRVRPHLDDKILTAWNGMMISAFALGAQSLGEPRYLEAAQRAADFAIANLVRPDDGALLRRYRDGEAAIEGFLDDYAFFATGLLDLYETCFEEAYLRRAIELGTSLLGRFFDHEQGGFHVTAEGDANLVMRMKDDYDGAEPSGNSAATCLMFRLAAITGREDFRRAGERTLALFAPRLRNAPHATPQMLVAYMMSEGKPQQIVITGDRAAADFRALAHEVHRRFRPGRVLLRPSALAPATAAMGAEGGAAAYVCEDFACQLPVTTPGELAAMLDGARKVAV